MRKALGIAIELLAALQRGDIKMSIQLSDDLKKVIDTFKISC